MNKEQLVFILRQIDNIIAQTETDMLRSPPKIRSLCLQVSELYKMRELYLGQLRALEAPAAKKPAPKRATKKTTEE